MAQLAMRLPSEASTAAHRRMRVRTIAGLEVERVSGGALEVRVAAELRPREGLGFTQLERGMPT